MSLTRQLDSTAQDFKYGLLAAKLAALLSRTEGAPISDSDHKDLALGIRCVRDHLHGAEVLYSGSSIASVTVRGSTPFPRTVELRVSPRVAAVRVSGAAGDCASARCSQKYPLVLPLASGTAAGLRALA